MTSIRPSAPAAARPLAALHLSRPGGRIAYEVAGDGPLILLVPGMGDLRSTYRLLAPLLCARPATASRARTCAGMATATPRSTPTATARARVTSSRSWSTSEPPRSVAGNSMGAGAAALAAAERPDLIRRLILIWPFVREASGGAAHTDAAQGPDGARLGGQGVGRILCPGSTRARLPRISTRTAPACSRACGCRGTRGPSRSPRARGTASWRRQLSEVRAPALTLMGELDPDFRDPAAEAAWIAGALGAETVMVPEAGHYPQSQQPEACAERDPLLPAERTGRCLGRGSAPSASCRRLRCSLTRSAFEHITLAALAARLGVRQPSLYKHVEGSTAFATRSRPREARARRVCSAARRSDARARTR